LGEGGGPVYTGAIFGWCITALLARKATPSRKPPKNRHWLSPVTLYLAGREICFRRWQWDGVILDEAQNIKNPLTKQAQAARSLKADYRIALNGNPGGEQCGGLVVCDGVFEPRTAW